MAKNLEQLTFDVAYHVTCLLHHGQVTFHQLDQRFFDLLKDQTEQKALQVRIGLACCCALMRECAGSPIALFNAMHLLACWHTCKTHTFTAVFCFQWLLSTSFWLL